MIKILLSGEGPTDYGKKDSSGQWLDGPVQIYMHKMAAANEITIVSFNRKNDSTHVHVQKMPAGLQGHGKKAYLLALQAKHDGKDCAAFYVDADKETKLKGTDEHNCKKRYDGLKEEVFSGLNKIEGIKGIAVIPMKMIESWLMGDADSFNKAFGPAREKVQFPKKPELSWGAKADINSNYPKNQLTRILCAYGQKANQDTFCQLAENADLEALQKTCPLSFADFYRQMMKALEIATQASGENK